MEKILNGLRNISRMAAVIALGAYGLIYSIYLIAAMTQAQGDAFGILISVFVLLVMLALIGALVFVLLVKNDKAAKTLAPLFLAWLILNGVMGAGGVFGGGASAVMSFLGSIFLAVVVFIFVLKAILPGMAEKPVLGIVSLCALGGYALFQLLYAIFFFVEMGEYQGASFYAVMMGLTFIAVIPTILSLCAFCLAADEAGEAKAEAKETEEPKEEEFVVAEEPVEEPKEEEPKEESEQPEEPKEE